MLIMVPKPQNDDIQFTAEEQQRNQYSIKPINW